LTPSEKAFLLSLLQLYNDYIREDLSHSIGRYKDMLLDIPLDKSFMPQGVERTLLSNLVGQEMGMTLSQYAALTFGLISRYMAKEEIFRGDYHFPINVDAIFSNSGLDKKIISDYLDSISWSQSAFVEEQKTSGIDPALINDFHSLLLKPIVHIDGDHEYYPTSLEYLQRLLGSGSSWVFSRGQFNEDLRNYWGQAFEILLP
jgi:hypothetical protein